MKCFCSIAGQRPCAPHFHRIRAGSPCSEVSGACSSEALGGCRAGHPLPRTVGTAAHARVPGGPPYPTCGSFSRVAMGLQTESRLWAACWLWARIRVPLQGGGTRPACPQHSLAGSPRPLPGLRGLGPPGHTRGACLLDSAVHVHPRSGSRRGVIWLRLQSWSVAELGLRLSLPHIQARGFYSIQGDRP